MAAAMDLIGTIDDDDFVPIEESDESENEEDKQSSKSRRKKKKKSERVPASELMLNESFSFSVGDSSLEMAPLWDLKETIQSQLLAKVEAHLRFTCLFVHTPHTCTHPHIHACTHTCMHAHTHSWTEVGFLGAVLHTYQHLVY
jgi:hypothetical protein